MPFIPRALGAVAASRSPTVTSDSQEAERTGSARRAHRVAQSRSSTPSMRRACRDAALPSVGNSEEMLVQVVQLPG